MEFLITPSVPLSQLCSQLLIMWRNNYTGTYVCFVQLLSVIIKVVGGKWILVRQFKRLCLCCSMCWWVWEWVFINRNNYRMYSVQWLHFWYDRELSSVVNAKLIRVIITVLKLFYLAFMRSYRVYVKSFSCTRLRAYFIYSPINLLKNMLGFQFYYNQYRRRK